MARLPFRRAAYDAPDEIAVVLESLGVASVVVDVEPFVCRWETSAEELAAGLAATIKRIGAVPTIRAVVFVTNSRRAPSKDLYDERLELSYVHSARKPLLHLAALKALPPPIAVIGDQPLTDGLLAWRLKASFIQLSLPQRAPFGVRLQPHLGAAVTRTLFAIADQH